MPRYKPMTHTIRLVPHPARGEPRRVPCRLTKRLIVVREHGPEHGGLDFNRDSGCCIGGGMMAPRVELDSLEPIEP